MSCWLDEAHDATLSCDNGFAPAQSADIVTLTLALQSLEWALVSGVLLHTGRDMIHIYDICNKLFSLCAT